jgi:aminopeptidase-like protein
VILNFSDGEHSLLEISDRSGIQYPAVREAAETLKEHDLLAEGDRAT